MELTGWPAEVRRDAFTAPYNATLAGLTTRVELAHLHPHDSHPDTGTVTRIDRVGNRPSGATDSHLPRRA